MNCSIFGRVVGKYNAFMKILLVGEYSRLHNSLKEGLIALGHEVTLIATGDYFKNYPADIKLHRKFETGIWLKVLVSFYKLFGISITSISLKNQFFKHKKELIGFDIVQLINESPFSILPREEKKIITFLKNNNKKLFLLSCGTDYLSVSYALSDAVRYSILEGYKNGTTPKKKYHYILKYISTPFKELHKFVFSNVNGVIASDIDYHLPLKGNSKYTGLIPNPINTDTLKFIEVPHQDKIHIFLGINRGNYHTKGIHYFEEALSIIQKKYSEKIKIEIVESLPYAEYIEKYNNAHIILDQVLAFDQGYNALEAMAKGKVVFTGAEKEFEAFYNLKKTVAINAVPDSEKIASALEDLILNPEKITVIGANAREFIEKEHNYKKVAQLYIDCWQKY
jgi:glycosyltransferase involved in cell wall biosynthesis